MNRKELEKNLPDGWEIVKLKSISSIRRGASPRPIKDPKYFSLSGRGWIRISDVTSSNIYLNKTSQYLSEIGVEKSVKVDKGDIIMSICGTIGIPIIINIPSCIHDGFVLIKENMELLDKMYLYYYILYILDKLSNKGQPGAQKNLNTTIVGNIILPLPPLPEQRKIADILTTWDTAIDKTESLINAKTNLKRGLMQKLLTGKVRFKEFVKEEGFKKTKIGEIPKDWEIVKIKDIFNIETAASKSNLIDDNGNFYIVDMGAISKNGELISNKKTKCNNRFL